MAVVTELFRSEDNGTLSFGDYTLAQKAKKGDSQFEGVAFEIESSSDVQVTLEVEAGQEYKVFIDNTNVGMMKANLGGKLTLSVELSEGTAAAVRVKKQ